MTREEAIHVLIELIQPNDDSEEAVDIAIKSLESREDELEEAYAHGWTAAEDKYYQMIVRCKDCVYSHKKSHRICYRFSVLTEPNGFCKWGERRGQ